MTPRTDDSFDLYRELAAHAAHLNGINRPRLLGLPYYEIMSGALIWTDETNWRTPVEVKWALRTLWAFRTSLMLKQPREELREFWEFGLRKFPQWLGFRPDRRRVTARLLSIYRRGDTSFRKCLRDLEREMPAE